jgi:transcriptional regulator with XRE-family HTH domain
MRTRKSVGARIKELRLAALLTQKQLATKLQVEPVTISRWERDEVPPSDLNRVRLGQFFGVSPETFRPSEKAAA